ncbi:ATP-binding cassette domain-containing protein [Candidatus Marinimicrobia bacterium]|nr:ATP-binding cassette domain-containing protein [Candidatus Neomarinimicrobiota bacterium]
MNETKRLIFKVDRLKKNYGSLEAVNVKKLEIHPGTIYALVGPPGSGKTTLLDILSGSQKQSSGELYFENSKYKTNWFGKVLKHDEIFYNYGFDDYGTGSSVGKIINKMYGKKSNTIMKRHFNSPRFKHLWNRSVSSLTKGELHWVGMVLSLESDPRVLLIDEYGVHITNNMEQEFRTQLRRMNRTLGTTIILSTPNEDLVKNFASVLIFMDNGHISKIRSKSNRIGGPRRPGRRGHFNHKKKNTKARGSSNKPPVNKQGSKSDQNSGNSSRGSSNKPPVNKQGSKSDQNSENSSRGSVSRHSSSKQNPESNNSPENKSIDTHNRNLETPSNPNPVSSNPNSGNESISLDIQTSVGKNSVSISKPPAPLETPKPSNSETIKPKNKSNNANAKTSANEEVVAKRSKSQSKEQTEKS